jgi:hypothetical protein
VKTWTINQEVTATYGVADREAAVSVRILILKQRLLTPMAALILWKKQIVCPIISTSKDVPDSLVDIYITVKGWEPTYRVISHEEP